MHGTLDIQRNSNLGSTVEMYQVRYEDLAGNIFSASMNAEDLHALLYRKLPLGLRAEELDRDYERLKRDGRITFGELEIKEDDLVGAGLDYLPQAG